MNIFLDTNILLSFYHYTKDDLEELTKLGVLLGRAQARLFLPEEVKNEFTRNREGKIADALQRLKEQKLALQFPQICKEYKEYKNLRSAQQKYSKAHATLLDKLTTDAKAQSLRADSTIEELFKGATEIPTTDEILSRARIRTELGNPPGKPSALGDRVCWESLLQEVPDSEDLYIVSGDSDYSSALDKEAINRFLLDEWTREKHSEIKFYKRLASFFETYFPQIKLASQLEKEILIQELRSSENFHATHSTVAKLNKHTDFSASERNDILRAALSNNQVYWIITDSDVLSFLQKITAGKEDEIEEDLLLRFLSITSEEDDPGDVDLEF